MTISILGGMIAKFANSDFLTGLMPGFASWLQGTGIRTIPAMYEIMELGIAFVIFAFLPITTFNRGHAVVDVFTFLFKPRFIDFLIAFWETVFFIVLAIITRQLFLGTERLMSTNAVMIELNIPQWWGYGVACVQMVFATAVSLFVAISLWIVFFGGDDNLPNAEGLVH